jgi:putative nucleotidyltransferase with HDIG domain
MKYNINLKDILKVTQNTINSVDNRLQNHGEQVAYIVYKIGKHLGYEEDYLTKIITLTMLHDLGAYKVEERKLLTEFETHNVYEHCIYGYLFIREFSPLKDLSSVILYHHHKYEERNNFINNIPIPEDAFLISLADRVSVLYISNKKSFKDNVTNLTYNLIDKWFKKEHVEALIYLMENTDFMDKLFDESYIDEIYHIFDKVELSKNEIEEHIKVLVYAIDFRSRSTVIHSESVSIVTNILCRYLNLDEKTTNKYTFAAILHDIGKITTPIEVLTKPEKLTRDEFSVMINHVVATDNILSNLDLDEIRKVASSHHEKLNGKGYPKGLNAEELGQGERILAVADIFSALTEPRYYKPAFPKAKVLEIMNNCVIRNEIDGNIVNIIESNFDKIMKELSFYQNVIIKKFDRIVNEYDIILDKMYLKHIY